VQGLISLELGKRETNEETPGAQGRVSSDPSVRTEVEMGRSRRGRYQPQAKVAYVLTQSVEMDVEMGKREPQAMVAYVLTRVYGPKSRSKQAEGKTRAASNGRICSDQSVRTEIEIEQKGRHETQAMVAYVLTRVYGPKSGLEEAEGETPDASTGRICSDPERGDGRRDGKTRAASNGRVCSDQKHGD